MRVRSAELPTIEMAASGFADKGHAGVTSGPRSGVGEGPPFSGGVSIRSNYVGCAV